MFDGKQGIALHAMQGNRASSRSDGEVSWFFSSCGGNLGTLSSYGGDSHSKLVFVHRHHTPVYLRGTPKESPRGLVGQYGRFSR